MIKMFVILCFFAAIFFASTGSGMYCPPHKPTCYKGYTYQQVFKADGSSSYACVKQNCSTAVVHSCDDCCGAYSNCTAFTYLYGAPNSFKCNKCNTGFVNSCKDCCEGYTCTKLKFKKYATPLYSCQPPKPNGTYCCDTFCPRCYGCPVHAYDQYKKPYLSCEKPKYLY